MPPRLSDVADHSRRLSPGQSSFRTIDAVAAPGALGLTHAAPLPRHPPEPSVAQPASRSTILPRRFTARSASSDQFSAFSRSLILQAFYRLHRQGAIAHEFTKLTLAAANV